jgi:hypothetical protein
MADLMIAMNQAPYMLDIKTVRAEALINRFTFLIDVETVTAEVLVERLTLLEFNAGAVRGELRQLIAGYRRALDHQYDLVLAPSGGETQETCR